MREHDEKKSRRTFLKSTGVAAAGLALAGYTGNAIAQSAKEALAVNGGPKTVTFPSDRLSAATKWPRYGEEEKQAVWEVMDRSVGD
ncbi:MAG TPA: twin-arginine translocation signal domain-containing protein, partial [bacterium]|nr:twin-arginine translocation signal domain-containing protein [bacterium]